MDRPVDSKETYWEWRRKNNPFKDPTKKPHKPGFFEGRPGRRIYMIYLPLMFGSTALMRWFVTREQAEGRGIISVPLALISDEEPID